MIVVSLKRRYVPVGNAGTEAITSTILCTQPLVIVPIRANLFHRDYVVQPVL